MKLRFGNISGEDILSFEKFEIDLSETIGKTTLIYGENKDDSLASSNGSGKSAIMETILWTLFGETSRPLRYSDEIINLQKDSCEGEVEIYLDEKSFLVIRSKSKGKAARIQLFEAWEDEWQELLKDSDNKTKQEYLEKMLGFNFTTFTTAVMFPQEFTAFPDLKPAQRAEILTEIGGLEEWVEGVIKAKNFATQINSDLYQAKISEKQLTETCSEIGGMLISLERQKKEWEEKKIVDIIEIKKEIRRINSEKAERINKENDNLLVAQQAQKLLEEQISRVKIKIQGINTDPKQISDTEKRVLDLIRFEGKLTGEISACQREVNTKQTEIIRMEKIKGGNCPTCFQTISENHIESCVLTIEKIISDTQSQIKEKQAELTLTIAHKSGYLDDLARLKDKEKQSRELLAELNSKEKDLLTANASYSQSITKLENIEQECSMRISDLEHSVEVKTREGDPYIINIEKLETSFLEKKERLEALETNISQLSEELEYMAFWAEGFKKVKMMLFDTLVSRLNDLAQEFMAKYSSELSVRITGEKQTKTGTKDEIHIEIDRPEGPISYSAFSGGERQKVKLSISLALSRVIEELCDRDCSSIFLDEPNQGLDDIGKRSNFLLFKELATEGKGVVVIDHDQFFQDSFDNTIQVIKESGYSRLN